MNRRTTFALDEETIQRLRKLAAVRHVSQAEVVRQAIEKAESEYNENIKGKIDRLRQYHNQGGVQSDIAESYLVEVAENRATWGRD